MPTTQGASLLPQDFTAGGAVPDGDYTIEESKTDFFDYGGKAPSTPCLCITYKDAAGTEYVQHYSAGKPESLAPSDDGKRFVHPNGETPHVNKSSNTADWLASVIGAGFPTAKLSDDVSVFAGTKVSVVNKAQPKRPGLKDQVEGKTIPLVAKILTLPGEKKAAARPTSPAVTAPIVAARASGGAASAAATASAPSAAIDLDTSAVEIVQALLATAPEQDGVRSITRLKLSTQVMLRAAGVAELKPHMATLKKMAGDVDWLVGHQEQGQWVTDGETVIGTKE